MTDNGRLLEVRGLSAGYGAGPVLFEIDLDVSAGELVAMVESTWTSLPASWWPWWAPTGRASPPCWVP